MQGSLGEKLAEGGTADVHAWAPGRVVKLFKAGVPRRSGACEARMARAMFAAGVSTPEVFDEVTLDGRFGIVFERLDGSSLLELTRSGGMAFAQAGAVLASLSCSVHRMRLPPEVFPLRDWMDGAFKIPGSVVPGHIATGILALLDRLPPGDGLCHGDLHPGNVIMTADGPRLAVHAAAQPEYARLAGLSQAALTEAIETWAADRPFRRAEDGPVGAADAASRGGAASAGLTTTAAPPSGYFNEKGRPPGGLLDSRATA